MRNNLQGVFSMTLDTYSRRIWAGNPSFVTEAQKRFLQNPGGQLTDWAVVLYNSRDRTDCATELMRLAPSLVERAYAEIEETARFAEEPLTLPVLQDNLLKHANRAYVLSTHLAWISRNTLWPDDSLRACEAAAEVCRRYAFPALVLKDESYTKLLIDLTMADLLIGQGCLVDAEKYFLNVGRYVSRVANPNMRARVYRKLGFLNRKSGKWGMGLWWGLRACLVLGVPFDVRLESVYAFVASDI